jgi:hypothetical protein
MCACGLSSVGVMFDVTCHRTDGTVEAVKPSLLIEVMSIVSALPCLLIVHPCQNCCSLRTLGMLEEVFWCALSCSCTSFTCLTFRGKHATLASVPTALPPHRKHAMDVLYMLQWRSQQ